MKSILAQTKQTFILSHNDSSSELAITNAIEKINGERTSINHTNKCTILLDQCSSWIDLKQTSECIDLQMAVATICCSSKKFFLSLRKNVATGKEASFQEILSWLCQKEKFYIATSIALQLLDDIATLQDLTGHEWNYSKEILDGITPLHLISQHNSTQHTDLDFLGGFTVAKSKPDYELSLLADMTVACMVKSGLDMSHALDSFLSRNENYNTFRACLILGAASELAVCQVSKLDDKENLASFSFDPLASETHALWPIQCLLRVAVTRNCMSTVLLLLNAIIPNEMRHISINGSYPSIALCKSIISMILASSTYSASILLNLVQRGTETFWASIKRADNGI